MKKSSRVARCPCPVGSDLRLRGQSRFNAAFGQLFHPAGNVPPNAGPRQGLDSLHRWNLIAINASGLDHTPVAPGENRVFGEQLGPGRASRAMAIVHIAMFDCARCSGRRLHKLHRDTTPRGPDVRGRGDQLRRRATRWRQCSHRKRRLLMPTWRRI